MTKKIAIIGTHSAGKSTFALKVAHHLRAKGENVDIVQERVRYSPFPFNDKSTVETAMWLYHNQVCRELESQARGFDTIVCDRSVIDCLVYADYWKLYSHYLNELVECAFEWMYTYDKIFLISPDVPLKEDGIRSSDEVFRDTVDQIFHDLMDTFGPYLEQDGIDIIKLNSSDIMDKEIVHGWFD